MSGARPLTPSTPWQPPMPDLDEPPLLIQRDSSLYVDEYRRECAAQVALVQRMLAARQWMQHDTHQSVLHIACQYQLQASLAAALAWAPLPAPLLLAPDRFGQTALHVACQHNDAYMVHRLVQAAAESRSDLVGMCDNRGWTALHQLCANFDLSVDLVKHLVTAAPTVASVITEDDEHRTALHIVCSRPHHVCRDFVHVVLYLVKAFPAAAAQPDHQGHTPLQLAVGIMPDAVQYEVLPLLLQVDPAGALMRLNNGRTLVQSPVQFQLAVLGAAHHHGDPDGTTALHDACRYGCGRNVIVELVTRRPDFLRAVDTNGWTSLHVACHVGAPLEIVQLLVTADPRAAYAITHDGRTALHLAAQQDASLDVLWKLARVTPWQLLRPPPTPLPPPPPRTENRTGPTSATAAATATSPVNALSSEHNGSNATRVAPKRLAPLQEYYQRFGFCRRRRRRGTSDASLLPEMPK